jgi:tetratricopeptide (TPR) repeat protein
VRTCREKNFVGQLINGLRYLGRAYVLAGRPADAIPLVRESRALQEKARVYVGRTSMHTTLAMAYLALGDLDQAGAELETALEFAGRLGERGSEGWAKLVGADLARTRGDRATAERYVDEAQEIAEELAMRPLLERCRAALKNHFP